MKPHIFVLLAVLVLIAAGCDAEDVAAPETDTSDTAPSQAEPSGPSEDRADAPSRGAQSGAAPGGADVSFAFESLFSRRDALEYTATYEVIGTGPGMPADMMITQYFGGADRFRTDSVVDEGRSRAYFIDGKFTACSQFDGEWMCFESGSVEGAIQDVDELVESGEYTVGAMPPRNVAGVNAQCFMLTMQEESQVEYCFSPEGIPLFIESGTEVAMMTWTASEYSLSVPADAWEVPESTGLPEGFDPGRFT